MDITTLAPTPPAPGSTKPGDLYIDLQSRTLWLGVDPAVEPAESVLISDMVGLLENDSEVLLDAKAYTDAQITTRAPISHTHTSSQITDFTGAVQSVVNAMPGANWISRTIIMWSGSLAEIGVGELAGWALCDGGNGTPDLRDRFIIGAGNKPVGGHNTGTWPATPPGPAKNFNTSDAGAHTHVNQGVALTAAQIPAHLHGVGSLYVSIGYDGSHAHTFNDVIPEFSAGRAGGGNNTCGASTTTPNSTAAAGSHTHASQVGGATANTGGGGSHTHDMESAGIHNHAITAAQVREAVPYFALAFIMKL